MCGRSVAGGGGGGGGGGGEKLDIAINPGRRRGGLDLLLIFLKTGHRFLEDNHTLTFYTLTFLNFWICDEGFLRGLLYWLAGTHRVYLFYCKPGTM